MTDADLVARARTGDQAAFGELVDRHKSAVYRMVRAALGSQAEVEEAAQDAFVLAWRRLDSFRGEASFRTWLLTIAWRQALNQRRGLTRWWKRIMPLDSELKPDAGMNVAAGVVRTKTVAATAIGLDPEALTATSELRRHIGDAIRGLTPKLRDTFLLAQSGECSYEEISVMVGAPLGTIKWRVAEARRLVKKRLQALGHELG